MKSVIVLRSEARPFRVPLSQPRFLKVRDRTTNHRSKNGRRRSARTALGYNFLSTGVHAFLSSAEGGEITHSSLTSESLLFTIRWGTDERCSMESSSLSS